ncbi:MAG: cyclase family protein [Dictyoglomus sp.]|nr:cyclase family protein [Dictyoglomus sp.]MDW8189234.1 cyclase family protein [Dictyoglomus sp.]
MILWDNPIDVSLLIHENMLFWPSDPKFFLERVSEISKGNNANLSRISLGLHTGTHIDTPYHFLDDGKTLEKIDISRFYGIAKVFEIRSEDKISLIDIEKLEIEKDDIILFKTKNSLLLRENIFHENYIGLSIEGAEYLVEKEIKAVGIDYLSIGPRGEEGRKVHKILLSREIGIVEGLDLINVSPGKYFFIALPLKIKGGEGSPVRAVLFPIKE